MSIALVIFAKEPRAGLAKTRLIPALGPDGAADLSERLLEHTVKQALLTSFEHIELCVTPDLTHPAFHQLTIQSKNRISLRAQGEGDLGARMNRALNRTLKRHSGALLIGTDAPGLDEHTLKAAAAALAGHDAVFVPTMDGGYALVGLRRPALFLFKGIAWSTPRVMSETRILARDFGLRWLELKPITDIDRPEDLVHLPIGIRNEIHQWIK